MWLVIIHICPYVLDIVVYFFPNILGFISGSIVFIQIMVFLFAALNSPFAFLPPPSPPLSVSSGLRIDRICPLLPLEIPPLSAWGKP